MHPLAYTLHYSYCVNTNSLEPIEHSVIAFNQTMTFSSGSRKRTKKAVVKQVSWTLGGPKSL